MTLDQVELTPSDKNDIKIIERTAVRLKTLNDIITLRLNETMNLLNDGLKTEGMDVDVLYSEVNSKPKLTLFKDGGFKELDMFRLEADNQLSINRSFLSPLNTNYQYTKNSYGSYFKFSNTIGNGSGGSVLLTYYTHHVGRDFIPIDRSKEYRISFISEARLKDGSTNPDGMICSYGGVMVYDNDKQPIYPQHLPRLINGDRVVKFDVSKGDTSITFIGDKNSFYNGSAGHMRAILVHKLRPDGTYGYTGLDGKFYTEMGYSRFMDYNIYPKDGVVDNGNGTCTINLSRGVTFDIPAGSKISNSQGGGTYNYWMSCWHCPTDGKKHMYKSNWLFDGLDKALNNYGGVIRDGVSFVRTMGLFAYRNHNGSSYGSYSDTNLLIDRFVLESRPKQ